MDSLTVDSFSNEQAMAVSPRSIGLPASFLSSRWVGCVTLSKNKRVLSFCLQLMG